MWIFYKHFWKKVDFGANSLADLYLLEGEPTALQTLFYMNISQGSKRIFQRIFLKDPTLIFKKFFSRTWIFFRGPGPEYFSQDQKLFKLNFSENFIENQQPSKCGYFTFLFQEPTAIKSLSQIIFSLGHQSLKSEYFHGQTTFKN